MSDYKNDTTSVKNSHNINKNRKSSDNYDFQGSRGSNINVMKSDSYNWLIGVVAVLTILLCTGVGVATYIFCNNEIQKLDRKVELISEYIISKGVK